MKRRLWFCILALVLSLVLLCGCGATSSGSGDYQNIKLVMAVNGTDTQIDSRVARYFAELVEERSGGSVTVDVFPNDQLAGGNATKGIEMSIVTKTVCNPFVYPTPFELHFSAMHIGW